MKYLTILAMLGLFLASCGDDEKQTAVAETVGKLPPQFSCADGTVFNDETQQCEAMK